MTDLKIRALTSLVLSSLLGACAPPPPAAGPEPARVVEAKLPVSAFIDSAGLHRALLAVPTAPADFRLKPLFTVQYDSTGALKEVRTISARYFPPEYGRQMVEILRAHVRPQITATKASWNHVWLQSGSSPKIAALSDLAEVRPRLVNGQAVSHQMELSARYLQEANSSLAGRRLTGRIAMRVSEEGRPMEPRLDRSTGDVAADREILTVARTMRFDPASLEGHPVSTMVTLPITLSFPRPEPQRP